MTTPVIRRHYPCQLQLQHWGSLGPHLVAPISSHLRHIDKQFVFRHRCDQFSIIHRAQIRKILQNTTMPTWGPRIEWYFSLLVGAWWETLAGWVGGWYLVTRSRLHTLHSAHQISLIVTFYYSAYVSLRSGGMIKPNNIIYPSWITSWTGCLPFTLKLCWRKSANFPGSWKFWKVFCFYSRVCHSKLQTDCDAEKLLTISF